MSERSKTILAVVLALAFVLEGFYIGKLRYEIPGREYLNGVAGLYLGEGRIICIPNKNVCQHEVGHAVEEFLGFPSFSTEFEEAIDSYIQYCASEEETQEVFLYLNYGISWNKWKPFNRVYSRGWK